MNTQEIEIATRQLRIAMITGEDNPLKPALDWFNCVWDNMNVYIINSGNEYIFHGGDDFKIWMFYANVDENILRVNTDTYLRLFVVLFGYSLPDSIDINYIFLDIMKETQDNERTRLISSMKFQASNADYSDRWK